MRLIDIYNHKFFWVKAITSAHTRNNRDAFTLTNLNDIKFRRYHIDGVNNIINVQALNKSRIVFLSIHNIMSFYHHIRIDRKSSRLCYLYLTFPNRIMSRNHLTVQIARRYGISIDNDDATYTSSHQCLKGTTTYATYTKERDRRVS